MLLLSIPKPCHENWNEMSPREQGAFCQVCSKTVIDFTSLSDEEVKNYFLKHSGQKTCGRLRNDQLVKPEGLLPRVLEASIPFWKKFLAIVFILFGSFLTGCNNDPHGNITGDVAATREVNVKRSTTLGMMTLEPDSTAVAEGEICVKDTVNNSKGEVDADFVNVVGETVPVIIEDDSICPEPPPAVDSVIKIFDKHGREIQ